MCTFLNVPILTHCELCGTEREASANLADVLSSYYYESGPGLQLKAPRDPIASKTDANKATEELLDFFGHDVNQLLSFVGAEMKRRSEKKQSEQEHGVFNMFAPIGSRETASDWWASEWNGFGEGNYMSQAHQDQRAMDDILAEIESYELEQAMKESLKLEAEMQSMQEQRRRQSMMVLQKRLSTAQGADGRRFSQLEAKNEILKSAVEIAALEEQEDIALDEHEPPLLEDAEPEPDFQYLPYVPVEGDEVDLAVANLINGQEIDLLVTRPDACKKKKDKKSSNAREYKVGGVNFSVRCIHGMVIAKKGEETKWAEFGPVLRELYDASN